jgi:hypothetical protein
MRSNRSITKDIGRVAAGIGIAGGTVVGLAAPATTPAGASITSRTCNNQSINACLETQLPTWKATATNNTGGTINGLLQLTRNTVVVKSTTEATITNGSSTFTGFYANGDDAYACAIFWRNIGGSWSIASSQCDELE